jgi:hypothetical protein
MFVFATLLRYHQRIARTSVITREAELHSVSVLNSELSGRKQQTTEYLFALKNWGLQRCQ